MPLILVPLGIILLAALALATAIAAVEQERARLAAPKGGVLEFLKGGALGLFGVTGILAKKAQQTISAIVSRFAGAKLGLLTGWFSGLFFLVRAVEGALVSFTAATADSIAHIATVVLPHEIRVAVRPVGRTARQALRIARSGRSLARRALAAAAAAAALARSGLIRLGHRVDNLDASLRWARSRIRALTDRVGRIAGRLSKVEKAVTIAALTGVIVKVLARRFPWLFCRKTNMLGKRVCGLDANYLESLLGTALLVASALSLAEMARALRGPTNLVAENLPKLIRELPGGD